MSHALLAPSSSERWINCPPSAKENAGGDTGSSYAQQGTDAHALCEYNVKKALGHKVRDPTEDLEYYDEEMEECATAYCEFIMEQVQSAKEGCPDPLVLVEQRLDFSRWVKDSFGTADCICVADGTMTVVDFKYGLGVLVDAEGNSQMRVYALGALDLFESLYDMLRQIKAYVFDDTRELRGRLFVLITAVTLLSWVITLAGRIISRAPARETVVLAVGIVLIAAIMSLSVRYDNIRAGAVPIAVGVSMIYPAITFFVGGGISGDAPLWFLFGIFFINVCLSGALKTVFLLLELVLGVVCWVISYRAPLLITADSPFQAHVDQLLALILIGASISIIIDFCNAFNRHEMQRSLAQKKEIEALSEAQNHFFSSMSHEIRTPINTIIALNEMILRENISDEVAEDAANIQSASKMLLHLINDILDMSKFASGQMKLSPAVYHPGDMLSEIVGMLWIRAKEIAAGKTGAAAAARKNGRRQGVFRRTRARVEALYRLGSAAPRGDRPAHSVRDLCRHHQARNGLDQAAGGKAHDLRQNLFSAGVAGYRRELRRRHLRAADPRGGRQCRLAVRPFLLVEIYFMWGLCPHTPALTQRWDTIPLESNL